MSRGTGEKGHRHQAAERLIECHERHLRRVARRMSICADDADDALQRALEIVLTKAPPISDHDLLRWTITVLKHECLAVRRRRERLLTASTGDGPDLDFDLFASDRLGPDERVERAERVSRGCEALGSLKPQEIRALTLKAQGYSYTEIAELNGWTYTKVNRCMAEGRQRFLEAFGRIEAGERCEQLSLDLSAFADGELPSERERALKAHLRTCPRCRAVLREARGLPGRALALVPAAPLAHPWWVRLHDLLATPLSDRLAELGVRTQSWLEPLVAQKAGAAAAVASAAVIAGGGAVAVSSAEPDPSHPSRAASPAAAAPAPAATAARTPTVPAAPIDRARPAGRPATAEFGSPEGTAEEASASAPVPRPAAAAGEFEVPETGGRRPAAAPARTRSTGGSEFGD